eukprot:sb/3471186/
MFQLHYSHLEYGKKKWIYYQYFHLSNGNINGSINVWFRTEKTINPAGSNRCTARSNNLHGSISPCTAVSLCLDRRPPSDRFVYTCKPLADARDLQGCNARVPSGPVHYSSIDALLCSASIDYLPARAGVMYYINWPCSNSFYRVINGRLNIEMRNRPKQENIQNSFISRSRDWLSAYQGPVFPDSVDS